MALIKQVELSNGVVVNYHRVVSVNNITNVASIIEIGSYTSKTKRLEEKTQIKSKPMINVFKKTSYINIPYNQILDVDASYAYLKTLDTFDGYKND